MAQGIKTGGRTKGTPNKITTEIRERYSQLVNDNLEQLQTDLDSLEPKDRIRCIIELSKFVLPTLKAIEQTPEPQGKIKIIRQVIHSNPQ
ncbi:MAG: hypothetical protein RQ875_13900 [Vicingaceae bacterium]|nr:hypothetical protein [Vicingaceae bacterium]